MVLPDNPNHDQSQMKAFPFNITREKELASFSRLLDHSGSGILSVYGQPGTGKSELMTHYQQEATDRGVVFYLVNAQYSKAEPSAFLQLLLDQMGASNVYISPLEAIHMHIQHLEKQGIRFVIAIDSYERFEKLDEWFRQSFLPTLPSSSILIFCGRKQLNASWRASIWYPFITSIELKGFSMGQFDSVFQTLDPELIQLAWQFSSGNPYALSLCVQKLNETQEWNERDEQKIYRTVVKEWLSELEDDQLLPYIEVASIGRYIQQEKLEVMLDQSISRKDFEALISLSFFEETEAGWQLNTLFQRAMRDDLRRRKPSYYHQLWKRALLYCRSFFDHNRIVDSTEISEFFYLLGEPMMRASLFDHETLSTYTMTSANQDDWREILPYLEENALVKKDLNASFVNDQSEQTFKYFISKNNNQESAFMTKEMIESVGIHHVKLLRQRDGIVKGIAFLLPIQSNTLRKLQSSPVTRSYFKRISPAEEKRILSQDTPSGWVIRYLGVKNPKQMEDRKALLYHLLPLVLTEGILVASTPLPFYQDLLEQFRFNEIPEAMHFDYGPDRPSKTYELDLRNARLSHYLETFANALGVNLSETPQHRFQFTAREQEVVSLVIQGYSNAKLAQTLSLSEVTIKKHLSRIYEKTGVKNRTQLTRVMLERK
ncbi:LuxR C-terminal-related transcriptional regulator [Bacillus sp. es.036]|uniref:LuxR C-terminal-related transcriptional regulator n=1 Tax=Bacillus sp. es.036 TaxID=1761764 RepID=UPI000BF8E45E|nr:LuxR C-terminal-related transcriptional regulator [Bacillus sp. es.036]PFG14914.1 AAA domain-containing protein [Bacillus sp. es.036]